MIDFINTEDEYNKALKRIDEIFDVTEDDDRYKELLHIVSLVEDYEEKHYPMEDRI